MICRKGLILLLNSRVKDLPKALFPLTENDVQSKEKVYCGKDKEDGGVEGKC